MLFSLVLLLIAGKFQFLTGRFCWSIISVAVFIWNSCWVVKAYKVKLSSRQQPVLYVTMHNISTTSSCVLDFKILYYVCMHIHVTTAIQSLARYTYPLVKRYQVFKDISKGFSIISIY